jgi:probable HAF family extracellular repeat protein
VTRTWLAWPLGACVALTATGGSLGSPANHWIVTDLLKLARQRYPAYVRVEPIGFGADGAVLWTASEPNVLSNPRRRTDGSLQHVFTWQNGKTRDLGAFGQSDNRVIAVNDHNQIAVTRYTLGTIPLHFGPRPQTQPLPTRAFLWEKGHLTDLGTLGGRQTFASGMNDRGQIVGLSEVNRSLRFPIGHAFLWQNGKMIDLGTLGGQVSSASAINDRGQITGSSGTKDSQEHAFLWQRGKMTDLGTLGGPISEAVAINERGQVIGFSSTARAPRQVDRPFLWQNGKMTGLGFSIDPNQLHLAINDDGEIAGTPEPSTRLGASSGRTGRSPRSARPCRPQSTTRARSSAAPSPQASERMPSSGGTAS